jgi:predicted amidohydrolase YtcJ
MLHCSGDAAADIGLNAYAEALKVASKPAIMRVEHFGVFQLTDVQLARARALKSQGLCISTQPIWLKALVKADIENMGPERARTGFRYRAQIDAGLEPAASTDMTGIYLGNINPFAAMHALVTRQSDAGLFEPDQAISVVEALRMWTIWPAKAMGEGDVKGTLEPGKYADMVVLSDDVLAVPADGLADVHALHTIVNGEMVYEAAASAQKVAAPT